MGEYVDKLLVNAWVKVPGEEPVEGFFALNPNAQFHEGPETLLERLNSADRVIPFERRSDDSILLLNRLEIEYVRPHPNALPMLICPGRVNREERVGVRLKSGDAMIGLLRMELPDWFNRASDFLNGPEHFFPLATDQGVVLVNKLCVITTRLYEASPAPVVEA